MGAGAMGAPLIGPVREALQSDVGISRLTLGVWLFLLTVVGSLAGMAIGLAVQNATRVGLFRAGAVSLAFGCLLIAMAPPTPGWGLVMLGAAWLTINLALSLANTGNGIFVDLWPRTPHTGVILLHAVNALGKLAAPLLVLVLGTQVQTNGVVYFALFTVLAVLAFTWPRRAVADLTAMEKAQAEAGAPRLPRKPLLWLCVIQFAFISGSEAGATSILGSMIFVRGSEHVPAWAAAWGMDITNWQAAAVAMLLLGIVLGRLVFVTLSFKWLTARQTTVACLACGVAVVPATWVHEPLVYMPALLITGGCFSATWPAFFGLAAKNFPTDKTFLSLASAVCTKVGVSGGILLGSAIGNDDAWLPMAFFVSTASMGLFAIFLLATPGGRRLRG